jgi:hypothetical protein
VSGTRQEIRRGLIRAQVVGLDATLHVFPCYFLGDPDAPVAPKLSAFQPRNLLGLTGVIDKLRITFDGTPSPHAPHGLLTIESLSS